VESYLPAAENGLAELMSERSNAFFCPGVGAVTSLKLSDPPMKTSFRATVERSVSRMWKLCTAVLSGVLLRVALPRVEGKSFAGSTGEAR